ncbi:MAG: excinuclease ABC subunit C, partial [Prolixibacteraceae bacterium]|nr:excinuclease ABC subunit C [Prolixibacteraceae bacterium]
SEKNVKYYILEKKRQLIDQKKESPVNRILKKLQSDLRLNKIPEHIECFDNSNLQGTNPIAACVVFKNAKPAKRDYRHFNVKTVSGPDDFASMKEIVFRRYRRQLNEGKSLPDLIVIDGGKGQLNAALQALDELSLRKKIPVVGIAKRLEEIYFPGDQFPLYIDKKSESLKLIQQLRDEAHRFGITFHRLKRDKAITASEIDTIKGIGEKTKEALIRKFKSVEGIKKATQTDLEIEIGKSKAKLIYSYFHK